MVYLAWRSAGAILALTTALALGYIGLFGFWERTISTIALVGASVLLSLLIGIPTGILLAKRALARRLVTPLLDVMQTLPTFVYLIPAVAFFSVGKTPAVIATVIFALAPMIRLTALGIQEVPKPRWRLRSPMAQRPGRRSPGSSCHWPPALCCWG